uniref:Uncharacterized protein n=1 Tax=Triticum urartu TaxID=4572 RepID=A0A8R7PWF5_TRIUA
MGVRVVRGGLAVHLRCAACQAVCNTTGLLMLWNKLDNSQNN